MSQTKVTANLIATGAVPDEITKQSSDPTVSNPATPTLGDMILNTSTGKLFVCTTVASGANVWQAGVDGTVEPFSPTTATGGTVTTDGDYKVHTFTSSSNFVVSASGQPVEYLVIAGGGGGSNNYGGGGAGGYRTATSFSVSNQTYAITVGAGGAANVKGSNSVFSTISSTGGGYGGGHVGVAIAGGSGGGGQAEGSGFAGGSGNEGSYTPAEGQDGGTGYSSGSSNRGGGGGGGHSAVGLNGSVTAGGNGGAGTASSITGSSVTRAGGGGAGCGDNSGTAGTGGAGGGGNGRNNGTTADAGTVNTGSGGGGGGRAGNTAAGTGGAGGSGVVIVRYKFQ